MPETFGQKQFTGGPTGSEKIHPARPRKRGDAFIPGVHEVPPPENINNEPTLATSSIPEAISEKVEIKNTERLHEESKVRLLFGNLDKIMQILSAEMNRSLEELRTKSPDKIIKKLIAISEKKGKRFDIDTDKGVFIDSGKVYVAGLEMTMETPGKFNETAFIGSAGNREVLVINDKQVEYKNIYNAIYNDLLKEISSAVQKSESRARILPIIYREVQGILGGTVQDLDEIISDMSKNASDPEPDINLGEFIRRGKGLCRHKAALAGYMLERLQQDYGSLNIYDQVELKRSRQGNESHAWLEIMNGGESVILDVEKKVVGIDKETASRKRNWQY